MVSISKSGVLRHNVINLIKVAVSRVHLHCTASLAGGLVQTVMMKWHVCLFWKMSSDRVLILKLLSFIQDNFSQIQHDSFVALLPGMWLQKNFGSLYGSSVASYI